MNKKKIYPQWFLILPLALYIIFFLLPSIMGVAYSFTDWNSRSVLNGVHFVELDNFKEIFTSNKDYLSGIGNTLKFTIISNIVKLIPALLIAIMLQEGLKGKGLYRTLLYLPSILPFVIIGLVFKSILNYNNGLLNAILDALHLGTEMAFGSWGCVEIHLWCGCMERYWLCNDDFPRRIEYHSEILL